MSIKIPLISYFFKSRITHTKLGFERREVFLGHPKYFLKVTYNLYDTGLPLKWTVPFITNDRPLWPTTVHFSSKDRFLNRPFIFAGPSTFAHLDHFGPHSLNWLLSVIRTVLFIYFWTVQFTSSWRVHCKSIEPSTVCLLRLTLSRKFPHLLSTFVDLHFFYLL